MPVLFIYGFPKGRPSELEATRKGLKDAIALIPELKLTKDQITPFFSKDISVRKESIEIVVFVQGLFETPERTAEVRQALADRICAVIDLTLEDYLAGPYLIECFIDPPFKKENGFSQIKR